MKTLRILALIVFLCACRAHRGAGPQPRSASPEPVTAVLGIDGTTSYDQLDEARRQFAALIARIPPGSDVSIRWISRDSYLSSCAITSATLPTLSSPNANPFDQRGKAREIEQRRLLEDGRDALIRKISTVPSPQARRTDIYGFLLHVSERRRAARGRHFLVAIASDLDSNVATYRHHLGPGDLDGCDVVILACAVPNPELRATSERELFSWGASSVRFVAVGEPLPDDVLAGAK